APEAPARGRGPGPGCQAPPRAGAARRGRSPRAHRRRLSGRGRERDPWHERSPDPAARSQGRTGAAPLILPPRRLALLIGAGLLLVLPALPAHAQSVTVDLGDEASSTGRIVQLLALLTVLSLAPGILVMVTSFTRIVVVLSFLRSAIGIQQTPPNIVIVSLA